MADRATAMTVRLPADLAEQLDLVATVDGQTQADIIRIAVNAYIATRKTNPAFQRALAEHVERYQRLVKDVTT